MNIIEIEPDKLIPYENNPRNNTSAVKQVMASIQEFGFKVPIVIDSDNVVIAGHTRLLASKRLGLAKVPCIIADDLTEEQIKAFRLADNKVSEKSKWDIDLLEIELGDIYGIDMEQFGFKPPKEKEMDYYGDERERTFNSVNLADFDPTRADGFYQMPIIKAVNHVPKDLISFNYVLSSKEYKKGVHFYVDDYQFERIWNRPYDYIDKMRKFDCSLTPYFSLYMDMPIAMQIWNVYRSRLVGQILQDNGCKVIPTLSWTGKESFSFCFDGLEKHGTVSVSTIGVKRDREASEIWRDGMTEALARLEPSHVVVYGGDIGFDFGNTPVTYIKNHNAERLGKHET